MTDSGTVMAHFVIDAGYLRKRFVFVFDR